MRITFHSLPTREMWTIQPMSLKPCWLNQVCGQQSESAHSTEHLRLARPEAMFLTCTDTDPLCADVNKLLEGNEDDFLRGATALAKLAPKTFLCVGPNTNVPKEIKGTQVEEFRGKHPAGLVGTHINTLHPVTRKIGFGTSTFKTSSPLVLCC